MSYLTCIIFTVQTNKLTRIYHTFVLPVNKYETPGSDYRQRGMQTQPLDIFLQHTADHNTDNHSNNSHITDQHSSTYHVNYTSRYLVSLVNYIVVIISGNTENMTEQPSNV